MPLPPRKYDGRTIEPPAPAPAPETTTVPLLIAPKALRQKSIHDACASVPSSKSYSYVSPPSTSSRMRVAVMSQDPVTVRSGNVIVMTLPGNDNPARVPTLSARGTVL